MLSNNIDIKFVPCILVVYPDGGVEKYEGSAAFRWVESVVRQYAPEPPSIAYKEPEQVDVLKRADKNSEPTPIEDLESEDTEDDVEYIPRPKAGLRMGSGNFEFGEDFGETQEQTRDVSRGIKEPTEQPGSRKGGLMAAAMAMQKSREGDDKSLPRAPGMPVAQ